MYLYLARSGGTVQLPDATSVREGADSREIEFLNDAGTVIARFPRADLMMYSVEKITAVAEAATAGENRSRQSGP